MRENRFPGFCARGALPTLRELRAPNAARQADATSIGIHHSAIATGEREQRHQIRWQRALAKAGLEREEIGRAGATAQALCRHRAALPRAVRGDDEARAECAGLPRVLVHDRAFVTTGMCGKLR